MTSERRCPHCDSPPTSAWVWGEEGTRWEGYWACPCGGWGRADQLITYTEDEPKEQTS